MEAKDEAWHDSEAKETKASRVDAQAKDAKAADKSRYSDSQVGAPIKTSVQPVQPEIKRDVSYWDGPDGILKRATAFVYRRIISPKEEGGMRDFFVQNCILFKDVTKGGEFRLEFMPLYREYEALVEKALLDFATSEKLGRTESKSDGGDEGGIATAIEGAERERSAADSGTSDKDEQGDPERRELARIIKLAAAESATKSAHRSLTMLAAAGDFKKFVAMMRLRASETGR